jgi:hypothetical protein
MQGGNNRYILILDGKLQRKTHIEELDVHVIILKYIKK